MLSSIKPFRQINILTSLQIPVVNYNQIQIMIFDFLFDEAHTKKKKKNTSKKNKIKKKKKKLKEKPIYCSNYLALMLHKTTQSAMSLSFEGYPKIQLLLETTMRQSQDSQQLRLWMASTHAGMDFFYPPSQPNKKTD